MYLSPHHASEPEAIPLLVELLRKQGFVIPENVKTFDHNVSSCVLMFQRRKKLVPDGIVGNKTWQALQVKIPMEDVQPFVRQWDVPYFSQRDNVHVPWGTCNVTSLAMLLSFYGKKPPGRMQFEDYLFSQLESSEAKAIFARDFPELHNQGYNPRNVHGMLYWLATQKHGMTGKFHTDLPVNKLFSYLTEEGPVILTGAFTKSGHIVLAKGINQDGDLLVHDPWGDWNSDYAVKDGSNSVYSWDDMSGLLRGNHKDRLYWAHLYKPK